MNLILQNRVKFSIKVIKKIRVIEFLLKSMMQKVIFNLNW